MTRSAILVATPEALASMLQLPEGCHIDAVWTPFDKPGVLHMRVSGAGWDVPLGCTLPQSIGVVANHYGDDGVLVRSVIDWGLPK